MKKILKFPNKLFLFFTFISVVPKIVHAQNNVKKDTIYYLVDTTRTSIYDRLINIQKNKLQQFYTINCPCLANSNKPVFRCNVEKRTNIDTITFKSLKLTYLSKLIELVSKNDNAAFNDKFTIFFIEPLEHNYLKHRAFFLGGYINKMN